MLLWRGRQPILAGALLWLGVVGHDVAMGKAGSRSRSWALRWPVAGAIALTAAGAAGGLLLEAIRSLAWAATGAGVAAVSSLVGALWWEAAREQHSATANRHMTLGVDARRLRVRQRVGELGRGGRLIGVNGPSVINSVHVDQEADKAGPDSSIIGYQGDDIDQ
jgi:hypothetical protein